MGLVTCEKCKKIYEYGKYNGICPKCARYNRETSAVAEHQEYHDKYDGGYNHTEQDAHHSYHQKYDDNKDPHFGQLAGTQMTLHEVMGAEHKVDLEEKNSHKGKMDKKAKIILGVFFAVITLNVLVSGGMVLFLLIISVGVAVYWKKRKM